MARTDPTIYMRLPEDLKETLDKAAAENKRSLTAEVVARLEQSFSGAASDASINALALRLAETELELRTNALESKVRLMDAHYAAESAIELAEFNRSKGYEIPLEEKTLDHIKVIYRDADEDLNAQTAEDFNETIKELEAAKERRDALRLKSQKPVPRRARIASGEPEAPASAKRGVVPVGNVGRPDPDSKQTRKRVKTEK